MEDCRYCLKAVVPRALAEALPAEVVPQKGGVFPHVGADLWARVFAHASYFQALLVERSPGAVYFYGLPYLQMIEAQALPDGDWL